MSKPTYIYQADVYCEACIDRIKEDLLPPEFPHDERTWDSDKYPKGPSTDEEADSFQHCCLCEEFLLNPLTSEGIEYTFDLIMKWSDLPGSGRMEILDQWVKELRSYGLNENQKRILDEYEEQVRSWKKIHASSVDSPASEGVKP